MEKTKNICNITTIETNVGTMVAVASEKGLCMLEFADYKLLNLELKQITNTFKTSPIQEKNPIFNTIKEQLEEYFNGKRKIFDVPLDLVGTEFQKQVWLSLLKIPYGATTTYAKQAKDIGRPTSVRAVANANGKNKISIILPCHRVIGTNGSLTGYGGGIERKKKLLDLEKKYILQKENLLEFNNDI